DRRWYSRPCRPRKARECPRPGRAAESSRATCFRGGACRKSLRPTARLRFGKHASCLKRRYVLPFASIGLVTMLKRRALRPSARCLSFALGLSGQRVSCGHLMGQHHALDVDLPFADLYELMEELAFV